MGAHRMHPAVLQDDDLVGVHHGGDALGDDELGHIPQLCQSGADLPLSGGVHGAGGVVEDQDFRPLEQGTGDAQPLLLPAGDVHASLAQVGVQALWHPLQKFGGAGRPTGRPQLLVARVRFPPPQILPHGAGEENVLLEHDAHRVPQSPEIVLPHIPAAHPDRPLGGVVQPGNELHQGSLGRASTAQDAHRLPCRDMELHAGEGVLPGAAVVFEGDPFKLHAAVGHLLHRILRRIQHNILVQHLADAAGAGQGTGEQQEHVGNEHHGVHHLEHIAEKASELPHLEAAIEHHVSAEPHDEHNGGIHDQLEHRQVEHGEAEGPLAGLHELRVDPLKLLLLVLPADKRLDRPDGGEALLHHVVQPVHRLLEPTVHGGHPAHYDKEDAPQNRRTHQKHQGQPGIHPEGEAHAHDQHDGTAHQWAVTAIDRVLEHGHIGGHAGYQ